MVRTNGRRSSAPSREMSHTCEGSEPPASKKFHEDLHGWNSLRCFLLTPDCNDSCTCLAVNIETRTTNAGIGKANAGIHEGSEMEQMETWKTADAKERFSERQPRERTSNAGFWPTQTPGFGEHPPMSVPEPIEPNLRMHHSPSSSLRTKWRMASPTNPSAEVCQ